MMMVARRLVPSIIIYFAVSVWTGFLIFDLQLNPSSLIYVTEYIVDEYHHMSLEIYLKLDENIYIHFVVVVT